MTTAGPCVFCQRIAGGQFASGNASAVAFPDAFPLSEGHTLIVPRRHEADFFGLTTEEHDAIWRLTAQLARELRERLSPDGFNVGVNVGTAAGQTVAHVHLHLIPRYAGDVEDPRGGIRWIIPAKAPYWET